MIFENWLDSVMPEMNEVQTILSKKLSDEPAGLIQDATEIEPWYSRMTYILAEANTYVDQHALTYLPPKGEYSELDRKVIMASKLSPIKQIRDKFESLSDAIKHRISLIQSILRYQNSSSQAPALYYEKKKDDEAPF